MSKRAKLRVCASCEWIFNEGIECPKCQFGSYGARYVYGDICYRYAKTQHPWRDKKLTNYMVKLDREISDSKKPNTNLFDINFKVGRKRK